MISPGELHYFPWEPRISSEDRDFEWSGTGALRDSRGAAYSGGSRDFPWGVFRWEPACLPWDALFRWAYLITRGAVSDRSCSGGAVAFSEADFPGVLRISPWAA